MGGSAKAAAFLDTVAEGEYKTYVFTFDGVASASLPSATLSGHGYYSTRQDMPDAWYYDVFTEYPSVGTCTGFGPCSSSSTATAGVAYLTAYTSGDSYYLTVDNRMKDFDFCPTATGGAVKMCQAHQAPLDLNVNLPGDYTYTVRTGAVPEPATWAMMIAGFGLVGATLRRRRSAFA